MDESIEEQVSVLVGASGTPLQVVWRAHRYKVVGRPVPWVDRNRWWTWAAQRSPQIVEQPMWTVRLAAQDSGDVMEADLSVTAGDWWRLERIRG